MRTILNFEMGETGTGGARAAPAVSVERDAPPSLFRSVTQPVPVRSRWGSSVGVAVAVHGLLIAGFAAASTASHEVQAPPEPEVVFYSFAAPPPPPAATQAPTASPQPKVQARRPVRRELVIPQQVKRIDPVPEVQPEPQPEPESVAAPVADAVETAIPAVPGGVAGGVVGGVAGGTVGGVVGAPLAAPLKLSQVLKAPRPLKMVKPEYPRSARLARLEGLVTVRVIIGSDGVVEPDSIRVMRSIRGLDEAAVDAIAQWRFSPAVGRDNRPVRVIVDVPMNFAL